MFAHLLTDDSIPTLRSYDTAGTTLQLMRDNLIPALPILSDERKYKGIIHEDFILDTDNLTNPISSYILSEEAVTPDEHFLNILKNNTFTKYRILPVIQEDGLFVGTITQNSILQFLQHDQSIQESGGILILEIKPIDYSMTEIAKITESNHANIIYSYISKSLYSDHIWVTLKINKIDLEDIVRSFERFNYKPVAVFHTSGMGDGLKERYDSLMVYLNV